MKIGEGRNLHSVAGDQAVLANQHRLELTCLLVVVVFSFRYFLVRGQINFLGQASNRLAADLRSRLFSRLLRLPISYFNDRRSGEIQSVLNNDVNVYQNAIGIIRDAIDGPIKAIGALVTILVLQPTLALIAFALIPVMGVAINRNSKKMKIAQTEVQQDLAELGGTTQEVLQGARVVKAFGAEDRTETEYGRLITKSYDSQMRAVNVFASLRPLVELIGTVALALLLVIAGFLAAHGRLNVADIITIAFGMDVINQGWRSLASLSNTSASVTAASDRIYGLVLDVPEEKIVSSSSKTVSIIQGRIEFQNVSFTYPDGTVALTDISFVLEPGESLALVGPSGAGKSTIADLLLRFYEPSSGRILIDGIDVRELDIAFIRSLIGVVPQHVFLFAGTIEDNVRVGRPEATDEEIAESISSAHATGFVTDMSNRTSSELGERGTRLSGGQMQRVAIARALVRKPTILLLDEATSALDAESEKAVTEALVEVMHQRTTLMIAHRLTTAARADKIIYMKAGRAVEEGSHRELMERNGEYAALFRIFSGGILETAFV